MKLNRSVMLGGLIAASLVAGGFLAYRMFGARRAVPLLSPVDQAMQDELSGYLGKLPAEWTVTLANPKAFDLRTRLFLAKEAALTEGLTRDKLAATPFQEGALAEFEAETTTYTPLPRNQPDNAAAGWASMRTCGAMTAFMSAWVAAGPFSPETRAAWESQAIRLSTDTDVLVRQHCAMLLWVISRFPTPSALSPKGAEVLVRLRADQFIHESWDNFVAKVLRPQVERAGRTWPAGV